MRVVRSPSELGIDKSEQLTLTIGNFDGLHRGHRAVLSELTASAAARGGVSVAATFDPHPLVVVAPEKAPQLLSPTDEKLSLFSGTDLDILLLLTFTAKMARTEDQGFLSCVGVSRGSHLVLGYDFRMGRDRSCDLGRLSELGARIGYGLDVVPAVGHLGEPISSSRIRSALSEGDVGSAETMLGRPYRLAGTVIEGAGIGRNLSCRTANLELPKDKLLPADGVYLVTVTTVERHPGLLYIGSRPTFGGGERRAEVHLLDLRLDLYGEKLQVDLHDRLRDDLTFEDPSSLGARIEKDIEEARRLFREGHIPRPQSGE